MIEHRTIAAGGVNLHVATAGHGRLVLFVHGFPEYWGAWKVYLEEFGRDHLAAAPDMRGYNISDKPSEVEAYAVPHLVADLRALILALGEGQPAVVVAHDWGAVAAWVLAAQFPDLVERLVIINGPHPATFARELRRNQSQREASGYMDIFRLPIAEELMLGDDMAALRRAVFEAAHDPGTSFPADVQGEYLEAWAQPGAITGALNYYRASPLGPALAEGDEPSSVEEAARELVVRVPTLVIWGDRDQAILSGCLDGLEEVVPDLRVVHLPEGTHWVTHEFPDEIITAVREFIAEIAPA